MPTAEPDWMGRGGREKLMRMWSEKTPDGKWKYSTRLIAEALGTTKNSVVGWAGRNVELCPHRESPINRSGIRKTEPHVPRKRAIPTLPPLGSLATPIIEAAPIAQSKSRAKPIIVASPPPPPAPIMVIRTRDPDPCSFITSEEPNRRAIYCNAPTVARSPYCEEHHALCIVPVPRRRKAQDPYAWADAAD